ncbi:Ectonucleoside triphosphate diphosphohydrolase 1 [Trichoplax sp. H2]|nr:Ectonucleoside triphosphate diphosphohydrolase 1 [Trichoplax sp. H2]|eukprot:RDD38818.1 Ectonucleoside triphosphate diphosphohydrolase 1 [Trichoplax sp. H2]
MRIIIERRFKKSVARHTVEMQMGDDILQMKQKYAEETGIDLLTINGYYGLYDENDNLLCDEMSATNFEDDTVVYLLYQGKGFQPTKKTCLCLALILGILGIIGIITFSVLHQRKIAVIPRQFGVVIDAGSTHTQANLYSWPALKINCTGVISRLASIKCAGSGIADYGSHPGDLVMPLLSCISKAITPLVPIDERSETELFLGATAGMRLLQAVNRSQAEAILHSIRNVFQKLPFKTSNESVKIITGEKEGAFAWIAINYITGVIHSRESFPVTYLDTKTNHETYGALDMGGASTQISFSPKSAVTLHPKYENNFHLFGTKYRVYSHSFLCYGINEITRRYLASLASNSSSLNMVVDPCAPNGAVFNRTIYYLYKAPCSLGLVSQTNLNNEIIVSGVTNMPVNITFYGDFNAKKCQMQVKNLFNKTECDDSCSFNGVFQPALHGKYAASSYFYYDVKFLNLTTTDGNISMTAFKNSVKRLCSLSWSQIVYITSANKSELPVYCFRLHYILTILQYGYGFNQRMWKQLLFLKKVNGSDLSWPMGYMLDRTNYIPQKATYFTSEFGGSGFIIALLLCILLILLGISFVIFVLSIKNTPRRRYNLLSSYGSI